MAAYLGEFEHLLLLTVLRLGADAFGTHIARELDQRAGRSVSRGALYTSLDRPPEGDTTYDTPPHVGTTTRLAGGT